MDDQTINPKRSAGEKAVEYVKPGMIVGLGTGSTAYWAIRAIGKRVKEGLEIKAIATSVPSEKLAQELGMTMVSFAEIDHIDITIDGADEINQQLDLIKGGGGALLREKIVASATELYVIIADHNKFVKTLGAFALPVEVVKFGWEMTVRHLLGLGCKTNTRMSGNDPFISDNGNFIIDCSFASIENPAELNRKINGIPGVVENGLFLDMADIVILGKDDGGTRVVERKL